MYNSIKNLVSEELKTVEKKLFSATFKGNNLSGEIEKFLQGSSKRIRSLLSILYIKAQERSINDNMYEVLAVGELIHNASLLHDDVIDDALTRRCETTIAQKYSPKISILSGNILVSLAIKKILNINNKQVANLFLACIEQMCNSEINQYLNKGKIPEKQTYINICTGKTAELFGAILKSSAILTEIDEEKAEKFAKLFGLVFQIKNDLSPESASNDKINKIYTAIDIFGIEKTNILIDNYKEEMRSIIKDCPKNIYKDGLEDLIKTV